MGNATSLGEIADNIEEAELESINSSSSKSSTCLSLNAPIKAEELQHLRVLLFNNSFEELHSIISKREEAVLRAKFENDDNLLHLASNFLEVQEEIMKLITTLFADHAMLHNINTAKMEPLHVAAACANPTAIKTLLKFIKPENRNRCWIEAKTPYIIMIKDPTYEEYFEKHQNDLALPEHQRRVDCLNLMLEYGLDINKVDFVDKTPMFWAASYGYKHLVTAILNQSWQQIDLDSVMSGKSPRKIILGRKLYPDPLPEPFEYKMEPLDHLFKHLRHRNIEPFVRTLNQIALDPKLVLNVVNGDNQTYTLLQFACVKNIHQIVDHLLRQGANPNLTIPQNRKSALEIAIAWANSDIIQLLLDHDGLVISQLLLHRVLEYAHQFDMETLQEKIRCVRMILKSGKYSGLHVFDEDGFIPLNYTALVPEIAVLLLANGASLACRNAHNILSVKYMELDTLTAHFNSCVKEEVGYDKEDLYIKSYIAKFDFRSLLQPIKEEEEEEVMKQREYISKSGTLDLGVSEEHDVRHKFEDTEHIISRETDVILYMSRNPKLRPLLKHPTVKAFLIMKWHLLRWFFYGNLFLYCAYCISQLFYVFNTCLENKQESTMWKHLLIFWVVLLTIRELVEIALLKKYYLFPREAIEQITIADLNYENLCELFLYCMTYFILFSGSMPEIRKQISIIVVLSTAAGLVLNLERMPFLNTKMAMLKRVTENIFKTFITFSIIIIPFALSFSILYKEPMSKPVVMDNITNPSHIFKLQAGNVTEYSQIPEEEEEVEFFDNFYLSVFKTVIMMTGEFEMKDSIDFEKYPIASSVLFLLFVFFVAIIVFNLLTGLAVSDTQAIVNEAELLGLISRTQHICYIESLLHKFNVRKKFCIAHRFPEIEVYPNKYAEVKFPPKQLSEQSDEEFVTDKKNGAKEYSTLTKVCMFMGINVWVLRLGDKIARGTLNIIEERNAKQRKKFKRKIYDLENENVGLKKRIKELKTEMRLLKENNRK